MKKDAVPTTQAKARPRSAFEAAVHPTIKVTATERAAAATMRPRRSSRAKAASRRVRAPGSALVTARRRIRSQLDASPLRGAVARARDRPDREDVIECGQGCGRRREVDRVDVLLEPPGLPRPGDGNHEG